MVSLLCGGVSPEHDISLLSAKNIMQHLQAMGHPLQVIYIDRQGRWWLLQDVALLEQCKNGDDLLAQPDKVALLPVFGGQPAMWQQQDSPDQEYPAGIVFPVLHGAGGEDGTIQGLLQLMQAPYVGADVLGCALSMDKVMSKQVLVQAGIACVPSHTVTADQLPGLDLDAVYDDLGELLVVKPACTGSSIGVSLVKQRQDLIAAIELALSYSQVALIEKLIVGRELECAVLGEKMQATMPGEIIVGAGYEHYDYQAKYQDPQGAQIIVPAHLDPQLAKKVQAIAWQAALVLQCTDMARVDFFLTADEDIYVNEVNSIPGFTDISMYSRLWQAAGVSMSEVLTELLAMAERRFEQKMRYRID